MPALHPETGQIREPARDLPVAHEADVLVVGGGIAGVMQVSRGLAAD